MLSLWKRRDEDKYKKFIRGKIREAREEREMSQADLAKRIYMTQKNVSDLERGKKELDVSDLMSIAYVLEKPIAYFFPMHILTEKDLSVKEWELIHFFRDIQNEAMEDLAIRQVKELAETSIKADIRTEAGKTNAPCPRPGTA